MDVVRILERLESLNLVRLNKIAGDYYSVYCPFHSNGQERRPSCGVLIHEQYRNGQLYPEGWWHCFTCGIAKSMKQAVEDILSSHPVSSDIREELNRLIGDDLAVESSHLVSSKEVDSIISRFAIKNIHQMSNKKVTYISEEELASYRYVVPYMYERKLTDQIINKYDIGVDMHFIPYGGKKEVPCITFPVRDKNGNVLFILRRAISSKRFFIPDDVQKPVYGIYELPKGINTVVVCESCFNALTSVRYGKPAVALLGTGTPYQIEQLKRLGVSNFILALDPDEGGRRGTVRLRKALKSCAVVWSYVGIPEGKDVNDLTEEEFNNLELE